MSMIGFAARPTTEVDPMCSTNRARVPNAPVMRCRSSSKRCGHVASYSTSTTATFSGDPPTSTCWLLARIGSLDGSLTTERLPDHTGAPHSGPRSSGEVVAFFEPEIAVVEQGPSREFLLDRSAGSILRHARPRRGHREVVRNCVGHGLRL